MIVNHVTTTLFTMTNAGINIFGDDIEWFTLRVSHTKIVIDSITAVDSAIQLSLSTVFVTWVRDSTLICPCSFTLARLVTRLFVDYI